MIDQTRPRYHFGIDGFVLGERPFANSVNHQVEQILLHLRPAKWKVRFTCFTKPSVYPLSPRLTTAPVAWVEAPGRNFSWRHISLPRAVRRGKVDVMWFPFHTIPLFTGVRAVVTVHDISFIKLPHLFSWQTKLYLGVMLRRTLAQASHIMTISQFTADELMQACHISADRITVVHHGMTGTVELPSEADSDALLARLGLTRPFFLFLDGANRRKNLRLLTQLLRTTAGDLLSEVIFVITGDVAAITERLRESGIGEQRIAQIVLPGMVSTSELNILYRRARGLLYLSEYEGFGLPILEAFARDCPVVALHGSSLPEIAGEAAIYVAPGEVSQLASAVESLLDNKVRGQMTRLGRERGRLFSWSDAADQVSEVLFRQV